MIKALEEYKPKLYVLVVRWIPPVEGYQKCNTNGTSGENLGPSSFGFCIRDHHGDLCYAQVGIIGHMTNIQAEAKAILEAVRYWERERQVSKVLETDSLVMLNIINSNWKIPWDLLEIVEKIQRHIQDQQITMQHIYREGNQLADYIANIAANEETNLTYEHFTQVPTEGRQIINTDKTLIPRLRIKTRPIIV